MMKNKWIMSLCFIALLVGCKQVEHKESEILVNAEAVVSIATSSVNNYTGIVEPFYSSMISFRVIGNIQQIYCDENEYVKKGQLLASLDKTILQNSYDAALSTLKQVEDSHKRLSVLNENNSLPEVKWIEAQTSLQNAQYMVNIAKDNLDNSNLYAPFDGVIAKRIAENGTNVIPGTPVFNLINIEKVKVKVPIPENEISNIKIGQKSKIKYCCFGRKYRL